MTEKEEKAIEDLNKISFLLDDVYSTNLVDDELRNKYQSSIDTILNMLEQKDKEIQELKADLYECNNIISDYIDTVKEKDKMIDEMAIYLADRDFDECCAEIPEHCLCSWEDYEPHTDCIKRYFQKKAREENENV